MADHGGLPTCKGVDLSSGLKTCGGIKDTSGPLANCIAVFDPEEVLVSLNIYNSSYACKIIRNFLSTFYGFFKFDFDIFHVYKILGIKECKCR